MKIKLHKNFYLLIISIFLFLFPCYVDAAGSATTAFKGDSKAYVGETVEVTLYIKSVSGTTDNGGLAAFGGNLSYSKDKLEFVSYTSLGPFNVELVGTKFGGFGQNTIKGQTNIVKLKFKAIATGSANISYTGSSQPDSESNPVNISGCSKTVTITEPPSSNNNLSSLTVSVGSINFDKNTTTYNVSVASDVTSAIISAKAEDSDAKVSGTGTKTLGYGNNKFEIVVTAPSGKKKTYTVNINRKDNRSSNNNLSSLSVNGGTLKPNFNKNTTKYTLSVPYSVSDLKISAKTEDDKAKVSISGNNNLKAEQTQDVTITVIAENETKKTYIISVTRGKNPNKTLSDNNYLSHLKIDIGILSPKFDKDKENYEVWLPYEVDTIKFDYDVEDKKYATVKFEGNETLQPGVNNIYKIIVKAENEEERTYTINVKRAKNPLENSSSNIYLKSLELENGQLIGEFNKEIYEYYYTKENDFKITSAIAEDENSAVSIVQNGSTYHIIVTSSNGEYGVYTVREQIKENEQKRFDLFYIAFLVVGFILGFIVHMIINKIKRNKAKLKKLKKNNN